MDGTSLNALWGTATARTRVETRLLECFEPRPASLLEVLLASTEAWTDREFLIQGAQRLSFRDFSNLTRRVASALTRCGIERGGRVALFAANSPAWAVAFFGILRAGGVAVLANRWWTAADLEWAVAEAGVALVVADSERAARAGSLAEVVDLASLAEGDPSTHPDRSLDESEAAYVIFTSGTTGRPRGALFSHRAAVANLQNVLMRTQQIPPFVPDRPSAVSLCSLPLFHMSGVQTLLQNLAAGGRLVFTEGRFRPSEVLDLIETERVTTWATVPTMLAMVVDDPSIAARDLSTVRSLAVGGAPVPTTLLHRAASAFPSARRRTAHSYGSTEAGGTVATGLADEGGRALLAPLPTVEVTIDAADSCGEGEILVRSPAVMVGYLRVPADQQPVDADGWLRTGDLGRLGDDGLLEVTGRCKDLIIRGGENVSPSYVEDVLVAHPAVAEAAVVGLPDPTWGEEVAAAVRIRPGCTPSTADLAEFVAARLARFAVPSRWLMCDGPLPLTDSGKVRKDLVRGWFG